MNDQLIRAIYLESQFVQELIVKTQTTSMSEKFSFLDVTRGQLLESFLSHQKECILEKAVKWFPHYAENIQNIVVIQGMNAALDEIISQMNNTDIKELVDIVCKVPFWSEFKSQVITWLTLGMFKKQAFRILGWTLGLNLEDGLHPSQEKEIMRAITYLSLYYDPKTQKQ